VYGGTASTPASASRPMKAQRPGGGRVQGRSYCRRWLAAPALTRVQPWTTPNNYTCPVISGGNFTT
jgi:hypothetical protein